jgi:formate dehydrogenase major subunit
MASALLATGATEVVPAVAAPSAAPRQLTWTKETPTICPYDASGCGFIVYSDDTNKIINLEGDGDHPINRGGACSKGASMSQLHENDRRLTKPLYRAPGAAEWQEISWDEALTKITQKIKETRDNNWIEKNDDGKLVNRVEAIASVGGSALDNEECYLLIKALRAMGLVYIEHHARL